jgi:hypothetical protein
MKNTDILENSNRINFDISLGMIIYTESTLKSKAVNYEKDIVSLSEKLCSDIMTSLLNDAKLLTDEDIKKINEIIKKLKEDLDNATLESVEVSKILSKIVQIKLKDELISEIKNNEDNVDVKLDQYINKTTRSGRILSGNSNTGIENIIDKYIKQITQIIGIREDPVQTIDFNEYKKDYLTNVKFENKKMFGSFADLLETTGMYLGNYLVTIKQLLNFSKEDTKHTFHKTN